MPETGAVNVANQQSSDIMNLSKEEIIFSSIFSEDEGVFRRKQELLTSFNIPVFKNEYYVFYMMTKDFPRIIPNEDFLRLYLQTNRAVFQRSRYIQLDKYRIDDNDPYVEFVNNCVSLFRECAKRTVSDMDFYRALEMHKMEFVVSESLKILEESALILSEGASLGGKTLAGYEEMRRNLKTKFLTLDNMVTKSERKGIITYTHTDEEEEENSGQLKKVASFGIEPLDEALGGIYEGDMISILAPAKGGKTRFSTFILHNAIVNHGTPVVMWPVENGYKGWEALIRARHFNWFYNSKVTDVTQKRIIDSDMIRKGELPKDLAEMELASWTDLRFNSSYGRFASIDEDLDFDTFLEVLEEAVNEVGAKLICVDYLQLITGGHKNMTKAERISEAYKKMLQFLKRKRIAGIFPAQLKQTVVGDIQKVDPEDLVNLELRDSAGESYEVIKTPDVNFALYGTVEDIRNGSMKIISIPSRNSAPFDPIDLYVDPGSCTFAAVQKR